MTGYYHARRKRDGVEVILWCFENTSGVQCVSCARTHQCQIKDFEILGAVPQFTPPDETEPKA